MSQVQNLFQEKNEATRYNLFRPHYHHLPFEQLKTFLRKAIPKSLDVACGTGHSTRSLDRISQIVVGCDSSEAMLNEARKHSSHDFYLSRAENLPFQEESFDYVNLSMAYQWLHQLAFLKESFRVLKPAGFLGIDNYGFTGRMLENEYFLQEYKKFDARFMKMAPRNPNYPDLNDVESVGFKWIQDLNYEHSVAMEREQFVNYLMTRSNFLQLDEKTRHSVQSELLEFYSPLFQNQKMNLIFAGRLKLYQRQIC